MSQSRRIHLRGRPKSLHPHPARPPGSGRRGAPPACRAGPRRGPGSRTAPSHSARRPDSGRGTRARSATARHARNRRLGGDTSRGSGCGSRAARRGIIGIRKVEPAGDRTSPGPSGMKHPEVGQTVGVFLRRSSGDQAIQVPPRRERVPILLGVPGPGLVVGRLAERGRVGPRDRPLEGRQATAAFVPGQGGELLDVLTGIHPHSGEDLEPKRDPIHIARHRRGYRPGPGACRRRRWSGARSRPG